MKIQILMDNPESWIIPYGKKLWEELQQEGHNCEIIHTQGDIKFGDILVLLGCEQILSPDQLEKHKHNLVVHESDIPEGKGWSPLTWQILDGKNKISITLFEAELKVDSGVIYGQKIMRFEGHELIDELRETQGRYTIELVLEFVKDYPDVEGRQQEGKGTYYTRRKPEDSELDPHKDLAEQFDLLRVVDNERYPAFFIYREHKYIIKIEKAKGE